VTPACRGSCAGLFLLISAFAWGCAGDDAAPADASVDAPMVPVDAAHDAGADAGPLCDPTGVTLPEPLVCNGHAELCTRSYADVSFAMAHNAMNSAEEGWPAPNQTLRLWSQLDLGIRGFMLDTYRYRGETVLCHGTCAAGRRPFVDALRDLRAFLDCHPAEVVTLILEAHIDEPTTAAAFAEAGLMPYLDEQPIGSSAWPTLGDMIASGRRLVVFTESSAVTLAWHHEAYAFMWDTNYAATAPGDFSCDVLRGSRANRLFLLNHFLTAPLGSITLAETVNHNPLLLDRARACQTETGFLPNFVALDFVDVGDLLPTVDALNGF
jgi:hypothetical protein